MLTKFTKPLWVKHSCWTLPIYSWSTFKGGDLFTRWYFHVFSPLNHPFPRREITIFHPFLWVDPWKSTLSSGFQSHGGTPRYHPFLVQIFHDFPTIQLGPWMIDAAPFGDPPGAPCYWTAPAPVASCSPSCAAKGARSSSWAVAGPFMAISPWWNMVKHGETWWSMVKHGETWGLLQAG